MIGSNGPRMLAATLPHVDRWNTWYDRLRQHRRGLRRAERVRHRAVRARRAGPGGGLPHHRGAGRARPGRGQAARTPTSASGASRSRRRDLRAHLDALERAGADEAILILRPITEESIRAIAGLGL